MAWNIQNDVTVDTCGTCAKEAEALDRKDALNLAVTLNLAEAVIPAMQTYSVVEAA